MAAHGMDGPARIPIWHTAALSVQWFRSPQSGADRREVPRRMGHPRDFLPTSSASLSYDANPVASLMPICDELNSSGGFDLLPEFGHPADGLRRAGHDVVECNEAADPDEWLVELV